MPPRAPSAAAAAAVAVLTALSFHLKVRLSTGLPRYDPRDEIGYYDVESALQYRYARLAAEGLPIPEVDARAQHPEGARPRREQTLWLERATGWAWRLLPRRPASFHLFTILFTAAVSSLAVPAFYAAILAAGGTVAVALGTTACYAVSWAAISDLIGTYDLHSFALPWIYASFALFLHAVRRADARPAVLSGLAMAAALGSWHVSRFYLAAFLAAAILAWLPSRRDADLRGRLRRVLGGFLAPLGLAGAAIEVLRSGRFLCSPAMILGAGWGAALLLRPKPLAAAWAGLGALLALGARGAEADAYGHVYGLLFEKLRHGLAKPFDPLAIGEEARLLWAGPYNSPEPGLLLFSLLPFGLLLAGRLVPAAEPQEPEARFRARLVDLMALMTAAGTALIARLLSTAAFFAPLAAARRLALAPRPALWAALLAAVAVLEGAKTLFPYSRSNLAMRLAAPLVDDSDRPELSPKNEAAVLRWLRANAADAPVLAHFGFSGAILAYTDSPVLLNPKLESGRHRAKCRAFLDAYYSDEEALSRFVEDNGARYVVHGAGFLLDQTRDGARYAAGRRELRAESPAVLFHLHPERLRRFSLVYENPDFRVFKAGPPARRDPPAPARFAVYDPALYSPRPRADGAVELDIRGVLERRRRGRAQLMIARLMTRLGQRGLALEAYDKSFAAWPPEASARREAEALRGAGP